MLGKILRLPENKPAQNSLVFAITEAKNFRARRERPQINLLDLIIKDVKSRGIKLETLEDIQNLRLKAKNEKLWNHL